MTSEANKHERRALELVEEALDLPRESRSAFIKTKTGNDSELYARVLEILAEENEEEGALLTGGARMLAPDPPMPETIGGYKIEREIGRGGMGAVYFGRRVTDDFEHVAAIKIVRGDLASPGLVERLRAERRTLARLKHPNIAQMYDGGETEDGAPYFIMEYVSGLPLNDYVAEHALSLDERLNIFLEICRAVSFAHRNLIIHRDLTPANIIVSNDGHIKLIDFGISHSIEDVAPENAHALTQLAMTKGYAAPERNKGAPASTITDIFSLGVILEELTKAVSAPRQIDLTAIVDKAQAETPEDRYQSVDALSADIRAYRRGDAVTAIDGGWRYFAKRFIARRKFAVGAAAAAFVSVFAASIVMSVLYLRAEAAERHAAERFDEVRELSGFIMFDFHDEVAKLEGSTQAREMLVNKALAYLDALRATPDASLELRIEIAKGYKRLSDVTGNPAFDNLGRREEASRLLDLAAGQIEELRRENAESAPVLSAYVDIFTAAGLHEGFSNSNFMRCAQLLTQAKEAASILIERGEASLDDRIKDAWASVMHGYAMFYLGEYENAVEQVRAGLEKNKALAALHPDNDEIRLGIARANTTLGEVMAWRLYYAEGENADYELTLPYFDAGVDESRKLSNRSNATPAMKNHLIVSLLKRANTTCSMADRIGEGVADLEEAFAYGQVLSQKNPNNTRLFHLLSLVQTQQGDCYYNSGEPMKAIDALEGVVARHRARLESEPGNGELLMELANSQSYLFSVYFDVGDLANGCANARSVDEVWTRFAAMETTVNESLKEQRASVEGYLTRCDEAGQ